MANQVKPFLAGEEAAFREFIDIPRKHEVITVDLWKVKALFATLDAERDRLDAAQDRIDQLTAEVDDD
jgi:hypothetical protein